MEISVDLGENDYDPGSFVDAAVYAERMGFRTVWFGDHIFPWYHSGKRSSFAWSVMGVALEKTSRIKVGPWVTVPTGARYHPAMIAQAAATLDNMYPGRLVLWSWYWRGSKRTPILEWKLAEMGGKNGKVN
jgi:coenzyme F420-dependent glucose-6-phosphate dehydrogenase